MLESVRPMSRLGSKVRHTGTPTYFVNGIRLGGFRPACFDAVIAYELKKAGGPVGPDGVWPHLPITRGYGCDQDRGAHQSTTQ